MKKANRTLAIILAAALTLVLGLALLFRARKPAA